MSAAAIRSCKKKKGSLASLLPVLLDDLIHVHCRHGNGKTFDDAVSHSLNQLPFSEGFCSCQLSHQHKSDSERCQYERYVLIFDSCLFDQRTQIVRRRCHQHEVLGHELHQLFFKIERFRSPPRSMLRLQEYLDI